MKNLPLAALLFSAIASAQEAPPANPGESAPASAPQTVAPSSDATPAPESAAAPERPTTAELGTVPVAELSAQPSVLETTPEPEGPRHLEEVIVTAQKTRQSARKVPISMTAMGGDFVRQTGAASLADISQYIPNVRVEAHDIGSPQVFIRGFGTNAFNPSFESSVALVQDELYFGRPGYFTEAMFDIDRIEVLRGPQGTLFGKNTVAGVFNVVTKEPNRDWGADGNVFYGQHQESRVEGGAGGMIGDWLSMRVSGLYIDRQGEFYNNYLDRYEDKLRQQAGRVKIKLFAGYGVESELTAVDSNSHAPFWPLKLFDLSDDARNYLTAFTPLIDGEPYNFRTQMGTSGNISKGSDTIGLRTHWAVGDLGPLHDFDPVLVLGWSHFRINQLTDIDVSPANLADLDDHEHHQQRSAELRFTGNFDSLFGLGKKVEFVLGGYWFKSDYTLLVNILTGQDILSYLETCSARELITKERGCNNLPNLPILDLLNLLGGPVTDGDFYHLDYSQRIDSRALFGQFTWNITDRIAITPGIRINKETKLVDSRGYSRCATKDAGVPQPRNPDLHSTCIIDNLLGSYDYDDPGLRRDESDVSPKLALQYFTPWDVNLYGSFAKGYKSGGFNSISFDGRNPADLEYEPEKARTWEVGAKGRFFNKTLGLNLAAFYTHFDNLQVLAFNGFFFTVSNAGTAYSKGIEADFNWLTPYAPLRIIGSGSVLSARYIQYDDGPAPWSEGIGATKSHAGDRIAFAPSSTGTLTPVLTYLLGGYVFSVAGDLIWQGDQYVDATLDRHAKVGGYAKYTARVTFGSQSGAWNLLIGGSNLTDKRVLNQVTNSAFFPDTYYAQPAAGRQVFAILSLKL